MLRNLAALLELAVNVVEDGDEVEEGRRGGERRLDGYVDAVKLVNVQRALVDLGARTQGRPPLRPPRPAGARLRPASGVRPEHRCNDLVELEAPLETACRRVGSRPSRRSACCTCCPCCRRHDEDRQHGSCPRGRHAGRGAGRGALLTFDVHPDPERAQRERRGAPRGGEDDRRSRAVRADLLGADVAGRRAASTASTARRAPGSVVAARARPDARRSRRALAALDESDGGGRTTPTRPPCRLRGRRGGGAGEAGAVLGRDEFDSATLAALAQWLCFSASATSKRVSLSERVAGLLEPIAKKASQAAERARTARLKSCARLNGTRTREQKRKEVSVGRLVEQCAGVAQRASEAPGRACSSGWTSSVGAARWSRARDLADRQAARDQYRWAMWRWSVSACRSTRKRAAGGAALTQNDAELLRVLIRGGHPLAPPPPPPPPDRPPTTSTTVQEARRAVISERAGSANVRAEGAGSVALRYASEARTDGAAHMGERPV